MSIILQRRVRRGDEFDVGAVAQDGLVAARHRGRYKALDFSVSARLSLAEADAPITKGKAADENVAAVGRWGWRRVILPSLRHGHVCTRDRDVLSLGEGILLAEKHQQHAIATMTHLVSQAGAFGVQTGIPAHLDIDGNRVSLVILKGSENTPRSPFRP